MDFSTRFKQARKRIGFTQQKVANLIPVSRATIIGWESQYRDDNFPTHSNLIKCAQILNVSPDWLRYGHQEEKWQEKVVFESKLYTLSESVAWTRDDVSRWLSSLKSKNPQGVFVMAAQEKIQEGKPFLYPVENNVMFDHNNIAKSLMIGDNAWINPGMVPELKSGQIVLAQFGFSDNFRFRQYTIDGNQAYLTVLSLQEEKFPVDEHVRILGVVTGIERKLL